MASTDSEKFTDKIGVYAQNSPVSIENLNINSDSNLDISLTVDDWVNACHQILAKRQENLSTNPLTNPEGINHNLDDIYVPLGLVEKQKKSQKEDINEPSIGSNLYQESVEVITKEYQKDEFFEQVLKNKLSPKSQG